MKKFIGIFIATIFIFLVNGCKRDKDDYQIPAETPSKNILKVYNPDSQYAEELTKCVSNNYTSRGCSLEELPLIRMQSSSKKAYKTLSQTPTKEEIMDRVVVSDKWMGDNFSKILDQLPDDIKELLGAVTAIVISKDIIPSYYSSETGAIYIDPRYLWLSPQEANTILKKSDFRDGYGKSLSFIPTWRYVKDNKYAMKYYSLDSGVTRTLEDIKLPLARVLYHELAHANDFAANIDKADKTKSIGAALEEFIDQSPSALLNQKYSLKSSTLKSLAGILYRGEPSTSTLDSLSSEDVGKEFEPDGASDLYGFNNRFEDFAMLFEETMMQKNFDIQRDVAFLKKDSSYTVGWGERGRIASENVKERAKFVAKALLPGVDWESFFDDEVGEVKKLKNVGWFESIDLNSSEAQKRLKSLSNGEIIMDFMSPEY